MGKDTYNFIEPGPAIVSESESKSESGCGCVVEDPFNYHPVFVTTSESYTGEHATWSGITNLRAQDYSRLHRYQIMHICAS